MQALQLPILRLVKLPVHILIIETYSGFSQIGHIIMYMYHKYCTMFMKYVLRMCVDLVMVGGVRGGVGEGEGGECAVSDDREGRRRNANFFAISATII